MDTNRIVFLVKFNNSAIKHFVQTAFQFTKVLKMDNARYGIQSIKIFDTVHDKFKRTNKERVRGAFSYDTEVIQLLKKVNFL